MSLNRILHGTTHSLDSTPPRSYHFSLGDGFTDPASAAGNPEPRGAFSYRSGEVRKFKDFTDGLTNTVLASERIMYQSTDDLRSTFKITFFAIRPFSCFNDSTSPLSTEGNGRFWAYGLAGYGQAFHTLLPPNQPSCNFVSTVSSFHAGGAQVLLGDGAVRFISENIDSGDMNTVPPSVAGTKSPFGVWGSLGSIKGGEVVGEF